MKIQPQIAVTHAMENAFYPTDDFFRMEKSVITKANLKELTDISGDHVAEAIIYHICYEHQYNLFGFGRIDPEEFGSKFGFTVRYLRDRHENPYQKIILKMTEDRNGRRRYRAASPKTDYMYDSRLENSLFLLANLPLSVESTVVDDRNRLVRKLATVRILKNLYVEQNKNTGKITYGYELEEGFRRNLSTYYQVTNTESIRRLRNSGAGLLYHHLLRLKDALYAEGKTSTTPDNTPSFAFLTELGGINTNQEPRYAKRDLNNLLGKINRDTELDFTWEWTKDATGQRYTPVFHFVPKLGEVLGDNSRNLWTMYRNNERTDVAFVEFVHNLVESCPHRRYEFTGNADEAFIEWVKTDSPEHHKTLEFLLSKTYVNLNCPIPGDVRQRVDTLIASLQEVTVGGFETTVKEIFDKTSLKPHGSAAPRQ